MQSILYITYDGVLEPLGQSQVLSYLEGLSKHYKIHLISFEKKLDLENAELLRLIQEKINNSKIEWTPLRYHKRLSAISTSWDICIGFFVSLRIIFFNNIMLIHARSYVPSIIALTIKKIFKTNFIFDMRGFWADERVDGGLWSKNSKLFRVSKWFEKKFLLNTDHIISLTEAGIKAIKKFSYMEGNMPSYSIIPTCADLSNFKVGPLKQGSFTLGYVGSVGLWYDFDQTLICFKELLKVKNDANLLIVNKNEHEYINHKIKAHKISKNNVRLVSAEFSEIPNYMNSMDAGIFFIKPFFSKQASAPTKLAEFLGCGVPCISNSGIGDMSEIFNTYNIGVVIKNFSLIEYKRGINNLIKLTETQNIANRCRETAENIFSLESGIKNYLRVYDRFNSSK